MGWPWRDGDVWSLNYNSMTDTQFSVCKKQCVEDISDF